MNPELNQLLQWGIKNSDPNAFKALESGDGTPAHPQNMSALDPELLKALMGGPSDAELMKESMAAIQSVSAEITLDDRLIAFDNFEQLIENLDNANNIEPLGLWEPLISLLAHEEPQMRKMAAWCIGTAAQNNEKTQEKALSRGVLGPLVKLALEKEEEKDVRRKAVYALSSECRNYQPALDMLVLELGKVGVVVPETDASDMDAIDKIMDGLREGASKTA